jgi:sterol 3beta-glucosyltransferase
MSGKNAEKKSALVYDALQQSGQRGVLASGWGGLKSTGMPRDVFLVDAVPHDWLFPQMSAVVHHGGAGTTAAGLRAGKPSVLCPFLGDQPFWGRLVHQHGVGPAPISQYRLTAERLALAIATATTDGTMATRAAELGKKIRAEDGIGRTVAIIDQWLPKRAQPLSKPIAGY